MIGLVGEDTTGSGALVFDHLVSRYYQTLYRFAFALTRSEADAADLTQETFLVWATKGNQLRDTSKVKTWMFTTMHRLFLQSHRRQTRFPHFELSQVETELPWFSPERTSQSDSTQLLRALAQMDEVYRTAVSLFYLEDYAYKQIAEMLEVPLGTVKSRIARGIAQLQKLLSECDGSDCREAREWALPHSGNSVGRRSFSN